MKSPTYYRTRRALLLRAPGVGLILLGVWLANALDEQIAAAVCIMVGVCLVFDPFGED